MKQIISGFSIIIASIWGGAIACHLAVVEEYNFAAFTTAWLFGIVGVAILVFGVGKLNNSK